MNDSKSKLWGFPAGDCKECGVLTERRCRGFCRRCYQRLYGQRSPKIFPLQYRNCMNRGFKCSVDGCERESHSRQLCSVHYERLRKNGVLSPKKRGRQVTLEMVVRNEEIRKAVASRSETYASLARRFCLSKSRIEQIANEQKASAWQKVSQAVGSGALVRPKVCGRCSKACRSIFAHHEDYSKPLEILWLCQHCHTVADAERAMRDGKTRGLPIGRALASAQT